MLSASEESESDEPESEDSDRARVPAVRRAVGVARLLRARRPGVHALLGLDALGDLDLLRAAGVLRRAGAAEGLPRRIGELQTAAEPVAGVRAPVAAALALGERVPVRVGRRQTGAQGQRGRRHRAHQDDLGCAPGEGARQRLIGVPKHDLSPYRAPREGPHGRGRRPVPRGLTARGCQAPSVSRPRARPVRHFRSGSPEAAGRASGAATSGVSGTRTHQSGASSGAVSERYGAQCVFQADQLRARSRRRHRFVTCRCGQSPAPGPT